ncbi:MAG: PH domain-containing protein [Minisyncoccia bacterium]
MTSFIHHILDQDERILLKVRKHWFLIARDFSGTIAMILVPLFFLGAAPTETNVLAQPEAIFLTCLWFLAGGIALATVWTNYYLDIWLVTDKRIVNVEQINLFHRETTTLRIERIQDASVEVHGFIQEMLGFGTIKIQSAGDSGNNMLFYGLKNPEYVRGVILEQVDAVTEHKNKIEFTSNEKPIYTE